MSGTLRTVRRLGLAASLLLPLCGARCDPAGKPEDDTDTSTRDSEALETGASDSRPDSRPPDSRPDSVPDSHTDSSGPTETGDTAPEANPCGSSERSRAPLGRVLLEDAWAEIRYDLADGFMSAAAADTDGDGCSEIAFGVYEDGYIDEEGALHTTLGVRIVPGPVSDMVEIDANMSASVHGEEDHFTYKLAVGDMDGDGARDDWLVGAGNWRYLDDFSGAVFLFPGPLEGEFEEEDAAVTVWGDDWVFTEALSAGDTDGDGYDDLVVGYPILGEGGSGLESGRVIVIRGPLVEDLVATDADTIIDSAEQDWEAFGYQVSATGDLDGNGTGDILVGAYAHDGNRGAVYVFDGPASGQLTSDDADALLLGETSHDRAGWRVSGGGDVDGDGHDDILVGAIEFNSDAGRVYLVAGPVSGTTSLADARAVFDSPSATTFLGWGASISQDLDGDGLADPAMGAPRLTLSYTSIRGAAFVYYGPVEGQHDVEDADTTFYSRTNPGGDFDDAGEELVDLGDTDGDGYDDLLIMASTTGPAFLFRGGPR